MKRFFIYGSLIGTLYTFVTGNCCVIKPCPAVCAGEPTAYNTIRGLLRQYNGACFYGFYCGDAGSDLCLVRNWQKRDELIKRIANLMHWQNPCELEELIRLFLPAEDASLRWHIAQYLRVDKQEELNSAWYNYYNPDLAQPNPIRTERVYRMVRDWREAHHENDQGRQVFLVEQLAPYFENKTIDFIAPLVDLCFHPQDKPLAFAISKYLNKMEQKQFETVWNFTMLHKHKAKRPLSRVLTPAEELEQAQAQERLREDEHKKFNRVLDDFQTHRFGHTDAKSLQVTSPTS